MVDVKKDIMEILVNKFGIAEGAITVNDSFYSMGMDSIAIVELQYTVIEKFGLDQRDLHIEEEDSVNLLQSKISFFIEKKENV